MTARRLAINWKLVEQRRIAAGLTHTQLADRVGTSPFTGPVRLWRDQDHDQVRLGLLERRCAVLDLQPAELFTPARNAPAHTDDDTVLEAALATLALDVRPGAALARDRLADALGWTLPRLDTALGELAARIAGTGTRLDLDVINPEAGRIHGLRPRHGLLTDQQRRALHQLALLDEPVDQATATVLRVIADPDNHCSENTPALGPDLAIRLQQQGLARRRRGGLYLELTDDVRFSLLLDDDPDPPAEPLSPS